MTVRYKSEAEVFRKGTVRYMKILLTSFEPFGGRRTNASFEAMSLVPDRFGNITIDKKLLPVEFERATAGVRSFIMHGDYEFAVSLGLAAGRKAITPERTAVNVMDSQAPDNAGYMPHDVPVAEGAPDGYFSMLPIKEMIYAIKNAGAPAAISESAGTYVCNAVMFAAIDAAKRTGKTKAGFIHLPPEEIVTPETAAEAIVACFLSF